jgi:hypothetical protein
MIKVKEISMGKTVSLFKSGLPRSVVLNDKTPKKVLEFLMEAGSDLVENVKEKDGSDNKK